MELQQFLAWAVASIILVNLLVRFTLTRRGAAVEKDHMLAERSWKWGDIIAPSNYSKESTYRHLHALWANACLIVLLAYEMLHNLVFKIWLFVFAVMYMLVSREQKGFKSVLCNNAIRISPESASNVETKTIIFIRHAESVWNYTFNRGFGFGFLFRLVTFCAWESFLCCDPDTVLFDSPLSAHGVAQSSFLQRWIDDPVWTLQSDSDGSSSQQLVPGGRGGEEAKLASAEGAKSPEEFKKLQKDVVQILRAEGQRNSVVVASNLRRAMSTALITLGGRFRKNPGETLIMHSSLQEATRNPDGLSLSKVKQVQPVSQLEKSLTALGMSDFYLSRVDPKFNKGNKKIFDTLNGRVDDFSDWVFDHSPSGPNDEVLIVVGHSGWFRSFFKRFLPYEIMHVAKEKKIANCGVVKFQLSKLQTPDGRTDFWVDPNSVMNVYGGYK